MFVSAGMIVGFDHDDSSIFEEQYDFLQQAQIPIVLVNALEAVPRTPLFSRLQAENRLLNTSYSDSAAAARYKSGVGMTNFRPLGMTSDELKKGLERLFQRLYAPEAFAARLMGNLSRFRDVRFRPEAMRPRYAAVFFRLAWYYGGKGRLARKFFWGCLWNTLRQSPRIVGQMVIYLGMYVHFCKVHQLALSWDPWRTPVSPEKTVPHWQGPKAEVPDDSKADPFGHPAASRSRSQESGVRLGK
jgi:Domain of unknown function (DUF4070)